MLTDRTLQIAVLPGDGIGPEVMEPALDILIEAIRLVGASPFVFQTCIAGAEAFRRCGEALPEQTIACCREADAILLGAMGDPSCRNADGTELTPQIDLRLRFDLYAGLRPVTTVPGLPTPLSSHLAQNLDLVLIRESTEGLFFSLGCSRADTRQEAYETLRISRTASARIFDFALALAARRKRSGLVGRVTCVDKANVFPAFAFFRRVFEERAAAYPDLETDVGYVDAVALNLVRAPWRYDVLVTENMFGDILSDICAGLVGGIGLAPSADIGASHAVFQPCHGSAPDIAGQDGANPIAMILSAALMLDWLAQRNGDPSLFLAAALIRNAINVAFIDGTCVPVEFGGHHGARAVGLHILSHLQASTATARA